ncbi:MAG: 50S ribosomal protein L10, partial [Nanoarchaeota archaeon]
IKNYEKLIENIQGVPLLMFTNDNPFELYKVVSRNKTPAFAKPGQISPEEISVDAGPTEFPAGPMIGEFGQLGIKTEVKEGKISVREAKILVNKGEVINEKVAAFLQKLGVQPMKVGMNVLLAYENGDILSKEILGVSEEEYITAIQNAYRDSMNLALNACYIISDTVTILIKKAYLEARSVAKSGNVLTEDTVGEVLAKASAEASSVQHAAGM